MQKTAAPKPKGVPFYKIHGAGNDILVLFSKDLPRANKAAAIRQAAHRQLGIGCDQVVEVLSLKPLAIQIWNQDGSKAEMCANGSRAFLYLAAKEGWIAPRAKRIPLSVSGGQYEGLLTRGGYELSLGEPSLEGLDRLEFQGQSIPFHEVVVGNPHAVVIVGGGRGQWPLPKDYDFRHYGAGLEKHPRFPNKTNVEFVRKIAVKGSKAMVEVDTWERGAGATLSCGSGAVAVAAVVRQLTQAETVEIKMTNFLLQVRFEGNHAFLSGPCAIVAKGTYFR